MAHPSMSAFSGFVEVLAHVQMGLQVGIAVECVIRVWVRPSPLSSQLSDEHVMTGFCYNATSSEDS